MALADVLRERVSRRGRTAEVACGLLGTVTVEALPPRECAALGMRDGGRALFYAACRDLQTAGETLRREGRLFTPAEVTAYMSDEEAAAAARTVLTLSGVTANGDGALDKSGEGGQSTKSEEVRLGDVQKDGAHLAVDAPSGEEIRLDGVQENEEVRLGDVRKKAGQKAEVRLDGVRNDGPHFAAKAPVAGEIRLGGVRENEEVRHEDVRKKAGQKAEIRLGGVRKPDSTAEDGQVSHEFFGGDGSDRTDPILGGVSDFVPQNLALSEENDRFSAPLELSGNAGEVSGRGSNPHGKKSEVREAVHEMKSEFAAERRRGLHESESEDGETVHEMKSDLTAERRQGLHENKSEVGEPVHETKSESAAERRRGLHETESEAGEPVHESKSESVERFAEGLLEGLRRAAAVR